MPDTPGPTQNRILAGLGVDVWRRLVPQLEDVWVSFDQTLHDTGRELEHVYFPTSAVLSLVRYTADGDMAEVALTGDEGVAGEAAFLGNGESTSSLLVKRGGHVFRLRSEVLREEMRRDDALARDLYLYAQALVAQLVQTGVCNRLHSSYQRLCRCLLQLRDRQESDELEITQEFISRILGMRRSGVTEAAGQLQADGVIASARGSIQILDRAELERRSCECYAIIHNETNRIIPPRTH